MDLIIDATVVFTAIIGTGVTKEIIFSPEVHLSCPKFLQDEIEEHQQRLAALSKLSPKELELLLAKLMSRIESVPKKEFEKFLLPAKVLTSDKDDTEYIALSLALGKTPIWSNDPHFKEQSAVKVFTTKELVDHLKSLGFEFLTPA